MTYILAIANQKGGVGKTTSAVSLAYELASFGRSLLLIDLDPQGSATSGLGVEKSAENQDLYDVFFHRTSLESVITTTKIPNLHVAPGSNDLIGLEIELGKAPGRELILKAAVASVAHRFDYVIIDCPPSSGLLSLNALGASNGVLIPLQAEYYALEGLSALMNTIEFVRQTFNPGLPVIGVFLTMFDARTRLSAQVEDEARQFFGKTLFTTKIPRNIKISECPSHGLPIGIYDPSSIGAKAYRSLAIELDNQLNSGNLPVAANS